MKKRESFGDSDIPKKERVAKRATSQEQRAWFLVEGGNLFRMNEALDRVMSDGAEVYEIRGRKNESSGDVLITIKARYEGHRIIAWHGDSDLLTAMAGAGKRLFAGTLKWREDLPYEERMNLAKKLDAEVAAGKVEL